MKLILFCLKKNISIIILNYKMKNKYNNFIIIIFLILNFNNIILYMNYILILFIIRLIDYNFIEISEISFHFIKFNKNIYILYSIFNKIFADHFLI